jgi:hypothetical protein
MAEQEEDMKRKEILLTARGKQGIVKISILKRVDSILVPRGVCRLLIGCTVIVKIVRYDYDMTVLWI